MTADRQQLVHEAVSALVSALIAATIEPTPRPNAPDRLLSVDEAARALGIGRSVLYGLIASGRVRSVKVGRRRLIPSSAVAGYIAELAA